MTDATMNSLIELYPTYKFPDCQSVSNDCQEKFEVICPKHGAFMTSVKQLKYRKRGCPKCLEKLGSYHKRSLESVIEELKLIYKGKDENIDWSKTEKTKGTAKIKLYCTIHGYFEKSLQSLKAGYGCRKCSHRNKYNTMINKRALNFEERARALHGDKYDYSKTVYTGSNNHVVITCPTHGDFTVAARAHLNKVNKTGCPFCAGSATCNEEFQAKVKEVTDGEILVGPIQDRRHKVAARCLKCGFEWSVWPNTLLTGHKCPICYQGGFNPEKPGRLYLVEFNVEGRKLYKVGITNRKVRSRVVAMTLAKGVTFKIVSEIKFKQGRNAALLEREIKEEMLPFSYIGEAFANNGMTEVFTKDPRDFIKDQPFGSYDE